MNGRRIYLNNAVTCKRIKGIECGVLETNDHGTMGTPGLTLLDSEIVGNMNWYYRNIEEN